MGAEHILVVEDDDSIAELIRHYLSRAGYRVSCYASGEKLLLQAGSVLPDLILLDLMLPGMDGLEICGLLREDEARRQIPIIMVTARGEEAEILRGLECGAHDYVVKPFSPRELLARVRAVLRRRAREKEGGAQASEVLRLGEMVLDARRYRVEVSGQPVALTLTEFRILQHLIGQPGRVFSRTQIVDAVRGADYHISDRVVETVRGVGYRLNDDDRPEGRDGVVKGRAER